MWSKLDMLEASVRGRAGRRTAGASLTVSGVDAIVSTVAVCTIDRERRMRRTQALVAGRGACAGLLQVGVPPEQLIARHQVAWHHCTAASCASSARREHQAGHCGRNQRVGHLAGRRPRGPSLATQGRRLVPGDWHTLGTSAHCARGIAIDTGTGSGTTGAPIIVGVAH